MFERYPARRLSTRLAEVAHELGGSAGVRSAFERATRIDREPDLPRVVRGHEHRDGLESRALSGRREPAHGSRVCGRRRRAFTVGITPTRHAFRQLRQINGFRTQQGSVKRDIVLLGFDRDLAAPVFRLHQRRIMKHIHLRLSQNSVNRDRHRFQIHRYLVTVGRNAMSLAVFDRRKRKRGDERLFVTIFLQIRHLKHMPSVFECNVGAKPLPHTKDIPSINLFRC